MDHLTLMSILLSANIWPCSCVSQNQKSENSIEIQLYKLLNNDNIGKKFKHINAENVFLFLF